jgi:hypothetical protein
MGHRQIHPMKQTIVTTALVSLLGVSSVFGEGTKIAVEADRISLFEVPLRCEAAPAIGCGSRSKPILLELEGEPIIMEAWLNGSGTVLAVVGSEGSSRESRNKAVQSVVEKNGATARELDGEGRETELQSFVSRNAWYRGAEVDSLSKLEARTIAARLVRRIQTKIALPEEKAKALETGLANVFERRFIGNLNDSDPGCKKEQIAEELSVVAHESLDERGVVALQEAFAKGIRPQVDDDDGAKTKTATPDCCAIKSPAQS